MAMPTNLALRPFRNERFPWLLAALLLVAAMATSILHGRLISRLLSGDEANTVRVVRQDEARIEELESGIASEPPLKIEAAELQRLRAFKELVDRRVFPWRRLLSELEDTLSADVRLNRISPSVARDVKGIEVELQGEARSKDAAFSVAETLDASPVFSNAVLSSLSDRDDVTEFVVRVEFDPDAKIRALTQSAPTAKESPAPVATPLKASVGRTP